MRRTLAWAAGMLWVGAIVLGGCSLALWSGFGIRPAVLQDWLDERALRRIFRIPSGLERMYYDGFPSMVGFGQREGLELRAGYQLTEAQQVDFIEDALGRGWQPLPIPGGIRSRILFDVPTVPMDARAGLFLCRTAGDDILHATVTKPCDAMAILPDVLLGVLDGDQNQLHVTIRAGY